MHRVSEKMSQGENKCDKWGEQMSCGLFSGNHITPHGEQLSSIAEPGGQMTGGQMLGVSKSQVSIGHP